MTTSGPSRSGPRPVMLARHRTEPEPAPECTDAPAGRVHLLALPLAEHRDGRNAVAQCGARIPVESLEAVEPGAHDVCVLCFTMHATGGPPAPSPGTGPFATPGRLDRRAAVSAYIRFGWPLTLMHNAIQLGLTDGLVAIALPASLAGQVANLLAERRCAPAVLAHPAIPSHRVILAGDRYVVPLSWPPVAVRITTSVPLPPTITPDGPVLWVRPPEPDSLTLCREIDVLTALRAVNNAHTQRPGPGRETPGSAAAEGS